MGSLLRVPFPFLLFLFRCKLLKFLANLPGMYFFNRTLKKSSGAAPRRLHCQWWSESQQNYWWLKSKVARVGCTARPTLVLACEKGG